MDLFSFLLGRHLGVELLGHIVTLSLELIWLDVWKNVHSSCPVSYSHQSIQVSSFSTNTYYCWSFYYFKDF